MKNSLLLYDNGKTGSANQCRGLAFGLQKYLDININEYPVDLPFPYKYLPTKGGYFFKPEHSCKPSDIIIASGRQAVTYALALKKRNNCFTIVLQHPRISSKEFDLVVSPAHDNVKGENVFPTIGALNHLSKQALANSAPLSAFGINLPPPYMTILWGGDSRHYTYHPNDVSRFCEQIQNISFQGSFLVTPSRRTPPNILESLTIALKKLGNPFYLWDGAGNNPYFTLLKASTILVVTSDSINMMAESCFQGKPTYIFELPIVHQKFKQFLSALYAQKHAQPLTHVHMHQAFVSLREVERIAPMVVQAYEKSTHSVI